MVITKLVHGFLWFSHLSDTLKKFCFQLKSITREIINFALTIPLFFLLQNPLPTFCIGARLRCNVIPFFHCRAFMVFVLKIYVKIAQ